MRIPGMKRFPVQNKTKQWQPLQTFSVDAESRTLAIEVLDDHPIRPVYVLGVKDYRMPGLDATPDEMRKAIGPHTD